MKDLYSLNLSSTTRKQINPFTNEAIEVPVDEGLNLEQKHDFMDYLSKLNVEPINDDGFRHISLGNAKIGFRDFGLLESEELLPAIAFEYDELNSNTSELLFDIMMRFKMVIRAGSDNVAYNIAEFPSLAEARWKGLTRVENSDELYEWLSSC